MRPVFASAKMSPLSDVAAHGHAIRQSFPSSGAASLMPSRRRPNSLIIKSFPSRSSTFTQSGLLSMIVRLNSSFSRSSSSLRHLSMKSDAWRTYRSSRCKSSSLGRCGHRKCVEIMPSGLPSRSTSGVDWTARKPAFLAICKHDAKRGSCSTSSIITRLHDRSARPQAESSSAATSRKKSRNSASNPFCAAILSFPLTSSTIWTLPMSAPSSSMVAASISSSPADRLFVRQRRELASFSLLRASISANCSA